MTITKHNGTIKLTSLAELGSVLELDTLPPGPEGPQSEQTIDAHGAPEAAATEPSAAEPVAPLDLASLLAQLASISSGLDAMARQDIHSREQAALDLERYEALLADKQDGERALAEVRRVRATADELAREAFTDEARAQAAQHAAAARAAELNCTQLLAERTRELAELAARPHLGRALADQQHFAEQQAEAVRRAEAERIARLENGLTALHQALVADQLDQAQRILLPLVHEFPDNADVVRRADALRWRLRQRKIEPAENALRDIVRRPYRDDPEAAVARLAELDMDSLPEDLARRVFGLWSKACYSLAEQRGWQQPRRHAPATSRGMIFGRPPADGPDTVLSSLGLPEWRPGDLVKDQRVLRASRPLEPSPAR